MRKKILIMSMFCLAAMTIKAEPVHQYEDSIIHQKSFSQEPMLLSGNPSYLKNVSEAANWGKNWFIEIKGGASAFLGTPIGCGDVFDRLSPALQVGLGKWFTPAVGGRVAYQGLSFKNGEFKSMDYHFIHADFLYNLTSGINCNDIGLSRWDVIPYLGVGMIYNPDWSSACMCPGHASGSHPFAFSYGLECRYRLNDRMHLVAELSGMTTAKNFDAVGSSSKFGDNMLTLSAGLSFTLGKAGYKRIVDAKPYIAQNEWLLSYAESLGNNNRMLRKSNMENEKILAEYQKILEMEGLLDLYGNKFNNKDKSKALFPRNDYSGLNSLRARLNNKGWDGNPENMPKAMLKRGEGYDKETEKAMDAFYNGELDELQIAYLTAMRDGTEPIGAPVYFFFNIGTDHLTDASQLLNIDELAKVAKTYNLKVKIIGAADSATGTDSINETLSSKRAAYIMRLMCDRGVASENIKTSHEGGIDDYSPVQANRNTCVVLSF